MSELSGKSSDSQAAGSGRGLHYVIAFTSFALVVLVLASGKVRERLREEQQEFHGIQQMQGARGVLDRQVKRKRNFHVMSALVCEDLFARQG